MGMDGGCQQKLRGHTTTPRSEAAALARRRWAVGFGARAPARTHDKAPRRAVKPPPSPAAGANSRACAQPLIWVGAPAALWARLTLRAPPGQFRSVPARRPAPLGRRRVPPTSAQPDLARTRARTPLRWGVMGPATDTPTLAEPLKVSLLPSLLQQTPGGHAG